MQGALEKMTFDEGISSSVSLNSAEEFKT